MDGFAIATDRDISEKARLNVIGESGAGKSFEGIDSSEAYICIISVHPADKKEKQRYE